MQATQALNGTYGLPAITERTLSEADQAAVRSLYGTPRKSRFDRGKNSEQYRRQSGAGGRWATSGLKTWKPARSWPAVSPMRSGGLASTACPLATTGRWSSISSRSLIAALTAAGTLTTAELPVTFERKPGLRQRAFRSVEIASRLRVVADKPTPLNYVLVPPQNSSPALNPRFIGINGELSTVPVPAVAGKKLTLSVAGEGLDQIPGTGLVFSSPFITIDQASLGLSNSAVRRRLLVSR